MSTLLNSIAYKPSLKVAPDHLLIKNSVHRAICKVSYSKNNPMFAVSQRTIKIEGDQSKYNPLNVDSSGITAQLYKDANEFSKEIKYNKDQIFKLNGRLFRVNVDGKTYAAASDFRDAIISGELTPIVSGLGDDHINSQPTKMAFNDVSVRGQAVLRHSAITASGELIDDLGAFGGSWDQVLEQSLIKPTINDLDREVVFTAMGIASKRPAVDLLAKNYISALNLSNMVELERQRVFRETGRAADTFVMSSNVLALLLANGHCEPMQEVEIVESVIEGEDGVEETLTEEKVSSTPNRFMTKSGILLMACDLFEPDNVINLDFDYFMAVAKVDDQEVG
ncbi:hypothetical protein, partial [Aeromonas jandaei]|uniref:hypothetical protein n=1 Tax=Aeromonas jandaei TaxID=650 RepID=UPI00366FC1EE